MVRKKRKGVVKESAAEVAPNAVNLITILPNVPVDARVALSSKDGQPKLEQLQLSTWYQALVAQDNLYEQLKALQLFRSHCKSLVKDAKVTQQELESFVTAAWRVVFRLYVAPAAESLRKSLLLILVELASFDRQDKHDQLTVSALQMIAVQEIRLFIDELCEPTAKLTHEQAVAKLELLLLVGTFSYTCKALALPLSSDQGTKPTATREYMLKLFEFCWNQLEFLSEPIVSYRETLQHAEMAPTNAVLMASERCGNVFKCLIILCNLKQALYAHMTDFGNCQTLFVKILTRCKCILQTEAVQKSLLTQVALAYCLLVRLLFCCKQDHLQMGDSSVVEFLLRVTFPEHPMVSAEREGKKLSFPCELLSSNELGSFPRLAVYCGLSNCLDDQELVQQLPQQQNDRTVLDLIFSSVHEFCQDQALHTRLYGFQVLDALLRRAVDACQNRPDISVAVLTEQTIVDLTLVIILNWEHPSKRVNQLMAPLFGHLVRFLLLVNAKETSCWKDSLVTKLLDLPPQARARYAALSVLLKDIDVLSLINSQQSLLISIVAAMEFKEVAPLASNLFADIVESIQKRDPTNCSKWRQTWTSHVASGLLDVKHPSMRSRIATYLLPLLLKKDPDCVGVLIEKLRCVHAQRIETGKQCSSDADVCLWGILEVFKFARKRLSPEKLVGISLHEEMTLALSHVNGDTRSTAFDALCSSLKSTQMPSHEELTLLKQYLVLQCKNIAPSSRMNTIIGLKNILMRIKETTRLHNKANQQNQLNESAGSALQRAQAFQEWMELFVVTCVYAGAIPQRTTLGLELMLLIVQLLGFREDSLFMSNHVVTTLLNMLISAWDSIRTLAFSILELYPKHQLRGYETRDKLNDLFEWALVLCCSARQRESDAGALFMKLLYQRSDLLDEKTVDRNGDVITDHASSQARFVLKIARALQNRLSCLEANDMLKGETPLVHGLLLSLRYLIETTTISSVNAEAWRDVIPMVFECVWRSMNLALCVVGDATSGIGDEQLSGTANEYSVAAEVTIHAKTTVQIPLRVDCRGHLILEETERDEGGGEDSVDMEQRAVVGSWLAARESGALLDTLMRQLPLGDSDEAKESSLVPNALAKRSGETLLNALFELKHKGAVAMAYASFEGVCRSFLGKSECNSFVGKLPSEWADQLLDRLEKSQQHFILRRSSGFAFSFLAILKAEPRHSAAMILPRVMENLLRIARLDTDDAMQDDQASELRHARWRSRIHALNILKLICQDAVLADDLAEYVTQMLSIAVYGFECRSWAVRNSSMMLFAAVTQRAIGDKRIADGASNLRVAEAEVFSRFDRLNDFLHEQLAQLSGKSKSGQESLTPPGLFPILMFLSRLKPSEEAEWPPVRRTLLGATAEDNSQDCTGPRRTLADFVPLVVNCASQPNISIRQMAARVLATIVTNDGSLEVMRDLVKQLPAETVQSVKHDYSSNQVHGLLLQLLHIINAQVVAKPMSMNTNHHERICIFLQDVLIPRMDWVWRDSMKCKAIVAVYCQILECYVKLDHTQIGVCKTIFERACGDLNELCGPRDAPIGPWQVPGGSLLQHSLVGIVFALRARFPTSFASLLPLLLQCPVLDVRRASFNALWEAMKRSDIVEHVDTRALLHPVIAAYREETHPHVRARQLDVIALIADHMVDDELIQMGKSIGALRNHLHQLVASSSNADAVALGLQLLMICFTSTPQYDQELESFLRAQLRSRTDAKQPVVLRRAVVKAIRVSRVLLGSEDSSAHRFTSSFLVDAWLATLDLLQDDDSATRQMALKNVAESLGCARQSETSVLPIAVEHIVTRFGSLEYLQDQLWHMLADQMGGLDVLCEFTNKSNDWGDLCGRIFEAESANYFVEWDLLAQLLVFHFVPSLSSSRKKLALDRLEEILQILIDNDVFTSRWLGGIAYYSSMFARLYILVCASIAALKSSEQLRSLETLESLAKASSLLIRKMPSSHPLFTKALEILAHANPEKPAFPLNDLLFMTPYWSPLDD